MFFPRIASNQPNHLQHPSSPLEAFPDHFLSSSLTPSTSSSSLAEPRSAITPQRRAPASLQVHNHYLAGRFRVLSSEQGLGLVGQGHALLQVPQDRTSSHARDDSIASIPSISSREEAGPTPAGPSRLADTPSQTQMAAREQHRSTPHINELFLGFSPSQSGANTPVKQAHAHAHTGAPHGAKHGSLRNYAQQRLKSQQILEGRIGRAMDVRRLEWEAKASLLHHSYPLAMLLLERAGALGSVSACLSLAQLYTLGVTRGQHPSVILLNRDPRLALSWTLEGLRCVMRRRSREGKQHAGVSSSSQGDTLLRAQLRETLDFVRILVHALRNGQHHALDASADVRLPDTSKASTLNSHSSAQPTPTSSEPTDRARLDAWAAVNQVCSALLESTLATSASVKTGSGVPTNDVFGPDEEDPQLLIAQQQRQVRIHLSFALGLFALRSSLCLSGQEAEQAVLRVREYWTSCADGAKESNSDPGALELAQLASKGLEALTEVEQESQSTERAETISTKLAPIILEPAVVPPAPPATGHMPSLQRAPEPEPNTDHASGTIELSKSTSDVASADSHGASTKVETKEEIKKATTTRRRRGSLEDLEPEDVETAARHDREHRPVLTSRLGSSNAPSTSIASVVAAGDTLPPSNTSRKMLGRTISESGTPLHITSPGGSMRNHESANEKFTLPLSPSESMNSMRSPLGFTRQRRPSSVISCSPSLMFPPGEEQDEDGHVPSVSVSPVGPMIPFPVSNHVPPTLTRAQTEMDLWHSNHSRVGSDASRPEDAIRRATIRSPADGRPRPRIASLYGVPSTASFSPSAGPGSTTGSPSVRGFDPTAGLRSRNRAGSVASASTSLSSIAPSTGSAAADSLRAYRAQGSRLDPRDGNAEHVYAHAQAQWSSANGNHRASDSLRRLRSQSSFGSIKGKGKARADAPMLTDLIKDEDSATQAAAAEGPGSPVGQNGSTASGSGIGTGAGSAAQNLVRALRGKPNEGSGSVQTIDGRRFQSVGPHTHNAHTSSRPPLLSPSHRTFSSASVTSTTSSRNSIVEVDRQRQPWPSASLSPSPSTNDNVDVDVHVESKTAQFSTASDRSAFGSLKAVKDRRSRAQMLAPLRVVSGSSGGGGGADSSTVPFPGRPPFTSSRSSGAGELGSPASTRCFDSRSMKSPRTAVRSFAGIDPTSAETYAVRGERGELGGGLRDLAKEMGKERERERERESHIPSSYMSPSPTSSAPLSPATSISASMQASMSTLSNGSTALTSTTMSTDPSLGAGAGADAGLDAALARAEERSKLKRDSRCDVCGKKVVNAPISRSGSTFCGRECRIEAKRRAKEVKEAMKLDGRKKTKVEERKNEVVGGVEQQRPVAGAGAAKEEGREENGRR